MCILGLVFPNFCNFGRRLFLAELGSVDFVCVENDCLEREIEQPAKEVAAYKDYQTHKVVLIEFICDNQCRYGRY